MILNAKVRRSLLLALTLGSLLGCDDAVVTPGGGAPGPKAKKKAAAAASTSQAGAEGQSGPSVLSNRILKDGDFIETEQNRDPFRNYAMELKTKQPIVAQRTVLMPNTALGSMRLIAIISGIDQPRAMIVDEKGVGYVTTRGDFVGRADVVRSGGDENLPVALNWRVDRIRENEVVLAREDPSGPNRPPLVRIIPLHSQGEDLELPESEDNDEG